MNALAPGDCQYARRLPSVADAITLVHGMLTPIDACEILDLWEAEGRVVGSDVAATATVPSCDRSAMDGFAFRFGHGKLLHLAGRCSAGRPFLGEVGQGECIAIATGGTVPSGCDTVAPVEVCQQTASTVLVNATRGANIRWKGEDFHAGQTLVTTGSRLGPHHIALLVAGGVATVAVRRRLRVAIVSIGDELGVDAPDRIHDANRPMVRSLAKMVGAEVTDLGVLPDNRDAIARVLSQASQQHDVIISSAGTSIGNEDHLRDAVLEFGGRPLVAGVAIKPGKPLGFNLIRGSLHIALPGNPAAAFISFAVLAVPLLRHLAGDHALATPWRRARIGFAHRKRTGITEYVRAKIKQSPDGDLELVRSGDDGAAMLSSLAAADGLVCLTEASADIVPGTIVPFQTFRELISP